MQIDYLELKKEDMKVDLFTAFNRYQDVRQCWRKEDGEWVLKDIAFIEDWDSADKAHLTECLAHTMATGGYVIGAFHNDDLVGFASLESEFFGSSRAYLQLSSIHISYQFRGKGIGKILFHMICEKAREMGAEYLYISAHSSKESQAFYKNIGCIEATEINQVLAKQEPCDCQLQFDL